MENNIPRRTPEEFDFYFQQKKTRINYYHSQGRISNEEYEKWLLSEDVKFEPIVKSKETVDKEWLKLLSEQPLQIVESKEDKIIKLLKDIQEKVNIIFYKQN